MPNLSQRNDLEKSRKKSFGGAYLVAIGIFLSRIAGLVRERIFASYFGNSDAGDAFKSALKIPNILQNLFGEGVLSASFIPTYSGLIAKEKQVEASHLAGVILSLLTLVTSILVLLGVWLAPLLIDLISPGFEGAKRLLTIRLVQIFFPGTGLLVLSAWCLGILNSHRKFFLSYVAPVLWNAAQIAALLIFGASTQIEDLAIKVAWALVLGSFLQFAIQLPVAIPLLGGLKLGISFKLESVREVIKNFFPVLVSRGVVQISSYTDNIIATLLPTGAVSALTYAQILYTLPVSLFGMSVSAAELPAMSSVIGSNDEIAKTLQKRLNDGLEKIAFYVIPSSVAFFILGDVIVATIYQTGRFSPSDTRYVWLVLAGFAIGLLSATFGRLYSSTFYALHDTQTPFRFAVLRIMLSIILSFILALKLPGWLNIEAFWGTLGITLSAGLTSWLELFLLRRSLTKQIGATRLGWVLGIKLWLSAFIGAAVSVGVKFLIGKYHPILIGIVVLTPYAITYLALTWILGVSEIRKLTKRFEKFLPAKIKRYLP
ncbi:MAG: murein biosynthesis integral membrane protein MurJ [Acidobacteria bacterium]|nr:murein biosynthesis integral membrane protein MurJ [Acidobacteriota bacterium]